MADIMPDMPQMAPDDLDDAQGAGQRARGRGRGRSVEGGCGRGRGSGRDSGRGQGRGRPVAPCEEGAEQSDADVTSPIDTKIRRKGGA